PATGPLELAVDDPREVGGSLIEIEYLDVLEHLAERVDPARALHVLQALDDLEDRHGRQRVAPVLREVGARPGEDRRVLPLEDLGPDVGVNEGSHRRAPSPDPERV